MIFNVSSNSAYPNARIVVERTDNDASGEMSFWTTSGNSGTITERLRIDRNGNLGIGTSSPSEKLEVSGNAVITGDLTVSGTTTTIDTTNLNVEDKNITINYSTGDSSSTADGAGITIQDAVDSSTDANLLWNATTDTFNFSHDVRVPDNVKIQAGTGGDLDIFHTGSATTIDNATGHLTIQNSADDSDIVFKSDDGSGGLTTYFKINGGAEQTVFSKNVKFEDSVELRFGNGNDMRLHHNGSNNSIESYSGNLRLIQNTDDGDILFQSDNGSGGLATYYQIDGGSMKNNFFKSLLLTDNVKTLYGTSSDLQIYHDGSNSYIKNETGNLNLQNNADDADIAFYCDDQSGGVAEYFRLDGSLGINRIFKALRANDDVKFQAGSGGDLDIVHSGTAATIENKTGNLTIKNSTDDGDIIFQSDDGSGGTTTYFFLDGGSVMTQFNERALWLDNKAAEFGNSRDLQIYHDGTDSLITNTTGDIEIINNQDDGDIIFKTDDGSGGLATYMNINGEHHVINIMKNLQANDNVIKCGSGSDLQLKHDGTDSFIFNNSTGDLYIENRADDKDIIFKSDNGSGGTAEYFRLDGSSKRIDIPDDIRLTLGTSDDLQIYHNATNSVIENYTGDLFIKNNTDDGDIKFQCDDGSGGVTEYFRLDGSVGGGSTVHTVFPDNSKAVFGTGLDTQIWHDGTNSYIKQQGGGNLIIQQTAADQDIILQSDDGSGGETAYLTLDGSAVTVEVAKPINLASASSSASSGIYAQFINLKGFCTLAANYQFAEDLEDTKSPFEMALDYGSATISSSTEVNQSNLFRAAGFHVPVACSVNTINMQVTCNNAGDVTIAVVEYRPSEASSDQVDHPRTVYEEVVVASNDNNNKVKTITVATADLDNTAIPAGSHIMIMAKGDVEATGGSAFISAAIEIKW